MRVFCLFLALVLLFTSCQNNAEKKEAEGINPNAIYYDYRVWGEEEKENVTVMLQYRYGEEDGEAIFLDEPSKVSLDGMELKPDSAKLTGVFYEAIKPISEFKGAHTIVFTDSRQKEHKVEFSFQPFTLASELPAQVKKRPFIIKLANFPEKRTRIQLVMIDTSYITPDVNEEFEIERGEISIDKDKLANLFVGPVTLEIYLEEEKNLRSASRAGGRILITYGLRRQFEFVE